MRAFVPMQEDPHAGHAFLHDFCMSIPYGALTLVGGGVSAAMGAQQLGLQLAGAGAAVCAASVLSLRAWRSGGQSTPYTFVSAGGRLL